ncbi:Guanine nucleotide-binding protein alpha-2 subunit [Lecanora helva]
MSTTTSISGWSTPSKASFVNPNPIKGCRVALAAIFSPWKCVLRYHGERRAVLKEQARQARRSEAIDFQLALDAERPPSTRKVIMFYYGDVDSATQFPQRMININHQGTLSPYRSMRESYFTYKQTTITFLSLNCNTLPKQIHRLASIATVVYLVDISNFDEDPPDFSEPPLHGAIGNFQSFIRGRNMNPSRVILVLHGVDVFWRKLSRRTTNRYLQDFNGEDRLHEAVKYIVDCFHKANHAGVDLYPFSVGSLVGEDDEETWKAIADVLILKERPARKAVERVYYDPCTFRLPWWDT